MMSSAQQLTFDDMAPSPRAFTTMTPVEPRQASLPFHPLANVFPLLGGPEFDELVADIEAHGVLEPIWLYQGQVLDGRNRYNACEALGLACPSREYDGEDPVGFVVSLNLKRRHLDESRRGMLAARLATMHQGERTDLASIEARFSQEDTAKLVNVSRTMVQRATKVQQDGAPEIVHAVDAGEITVSAALPLTGLSKEEQPAALEEAKRHAPGKKLTAPRMQAAVAAQQPPLSPANAESPHADRQTDDAFAQQLACRDLLRVVTELARWDGDVDMAITTMAPDDRERLHSTLDGASAMVQRLTALLRPAPISPHVTPKAKTETKAGAKKQAKNKKEKRLQYGGKKAQLVATALTFERFTVAMVTRALGKPSKWAGKAFHELLRTREVHHGKYLVYEPETELPYVWMAAVEVQ